MSDEEVTKPTATEKGKSFLELALGSTVIVTVVVGLLFLLGYSYLSQYYDAFDIDVWALDLPAYAPLVYSVLPVLASGVILVELVVLLGTLLSYFFRVSRNTWLALLILNCVIPLIVFLGALGAAFKEGTKQSAAAYRNSAQAYLTFNAGALGSVDPKLKRSNDCGNLRLLTQTKDLVVVFEKPSQKGQKTKSVFVVKRADLSSVHSWDPPPKFLPPPRGVPQQNCID